MKIKKEESNIRLDKFLTEELQKTRSFILSNIKSGNILVNGSIVKAGYLLKENDKITVNLKEKETNVAPEDIPLNIIYEDESIIVVNKPSGLVVHPGAGNLNGTLVNALLYHTNNNLSDINGNIRPGIVHRIDKDTSGLLLVSKTNEAHVKLASDFKNKRVKRKYIALVSGVIKEDAGRIVAPIGRSEDDRKKMKVKENGRRAITNFKVLERFNNTTLVEFVLETGRTHQIRVHTSYINHPIVNDPVYGKKINEYGQMLHAEYIGFLHPITNEFMEFSVPAEPEFAKLLETFKNS